MISTVEKVLFLKGVSLFVTLPGEELSYIAQIAEECEYPSQSVIFNEGDEGDAMYVIVRGQVKVHSGQQVYAKLGEKEVFGEMSILDAERRSATITTLSELTALRIGLEDFSEILAAKPDIALGIIQVLTKRLRDMNRQINQIQAQIKAPPREESGGHATAQAKAAAEASS